MTEKRVRVLRVSIPFFVVGGYLTLVIYNAFLLHENRRLKASLAACETEHHWIEYDVDALCDEVENDSRSGTSPFSRATP